MEEEIIENNKKQEIESQVPSELETLKAQCEEYLNGWKRAKADLANSKAEEGRRLTEFAKFVSEAVMKDLTAVLDSFALGAAAVPETNEAKKGLLIIQSQLEEALKKHGLEKITANVGDAFDPAKHEAMALVDGAGKPPETVAQEIEKGYSLNGKVLKPARVIVTK
ncbi:MAG: nucleotide exchange factor GrpE [bacterium]|nr:nucleotide exchange factor GrpE [bacterium]